MSIQLAINHDYAVAVLGTQIFSGMFVLFILTSHRLGLHSFCARSSIEISNSGQVRNYFNICAALTPPSELTQLWNEYTDYNGKSLLIIIEAQVVFILSTLVAPGHRVCDTGVPL